MLFPLAGRLNERAKQNAAGSEKTTCFVWISKTF
jgi:hypothetical protein